ncbi:MAG: tyrosine-type recombinase/integrase, partial [Xanthobacteraceae bacterium]
MTFRQCAESYMASHEDAWRNAIHRNQWRRSLTTYVYPALGDLPVAAIDTGLVMKIIEPLWKSKTETASRVRARIEGVLDWAKVRGFRTGENPARWRGHLDHLLPARIRVKRVKHFAAMPYAEIGDFMADLREQTNLGARALEFTILTAARTEQTRGATWHEIDLRAKIWTIPAERMKGGREHKVPLSAPALALLTDMASIRRGDFVFPGSREGPIYARAMAMALGRQTRDDITVHGFRSTFRDWAAEQTDFPSEAAEMALAHAVGNKV